MRKTLTLMLILAGSAIVWGAAPRPAANLNTVVQELESATFDRTSWSLFFTYEERKLQYEPTNADLIPAAIATWLSGPPGTDKQGNVIARDLYLRDYIKKNQQAISKVFAGLKLIGSELGRFIYLRRDDGSPVNIPVKIARWKDGLALLITGVAYPTTFNTIRTTPKTRAARIIEATIIPSLRAFDTAGLPSELGYFGMAVVYGTRNFLDDSKALNDKPEMVGKRKGDILLFLAK